MGQLIGLLLFIIFVVVIHRSMYAKNKQGVITIKDHEYSYLLGDAIILLGQVRARGIDILLPTHVPHIYLDSHSDSKFIGTAYHIDIQQKVSLEGDFDRYFQTFIANGFTAEGLSFLTPDLLQVLISTSNKYDLEFYENHLKIFSKRRVYENTERESEVLKIAETVLQQIDHKLKSWSSRNAKNSKYANLKVSQDFNLKFGTSYTAFNRVIYVAFYGLFGILFSFGFTQILNPSEGVSRIDGLILCIVLLFVVVLVQKKLFSKLDIKYTKPSKKL